MPRLTIGPAAKYRVNTDLEPIDLGLTVFTDGANFKLTSKGITTFNGFKTISAPISASTIETWDTPDSTWDADIYTWEQSEPTKAGLLVYVPGSIESYFLVACLNRVIIFDGSNWSSVSPDLPYLPSNSDSELLWTACKIGEALVLNNPQAYPTYWRPTVQGVQFLPLKFSPTATWKDVGKRANVVRAHKNFLFALNLRESIQDLPTSYRWSHPADTNGLPFTWDETDLSAIAGISSIESSGGSIVDGLSLRDSFVIYAERSIHILDYTGDEFVWRRRELTTSYGLLAVNCVVEVLGMHYFMTDSDIMLTDGNSVTSLLYNEFQSKFKDNLNQKAYKTAFTTANYSTKELWFCFPAGDSTIPDKAIVYNWLNNQLFYRDLPNIVSCAVGPTLTSSETWDTAIGVWDGDTTPWNTAFATYFNYHVVGLQQNGTIGNLEENTVNVPFDTQIEKLSFALTQDPSVSASTISLVYPKIHCAGKVKFQFGVQDDFFDDINWGEEFEFYPLTSKQVEPRSGAGKYHSFRLSSVDDKPFTFAGMYISYIDRGSR